MFVTTGSPVRPGSGERTLLLKEKQLLPDSVLGEGKRKCPISFSSSLLTSLLPLPPMDTEGQEAWVMCSVMLAHRIQSKRKG